MKKFLRIVSVAAGIISIVSAVVLVCICIEDIAVYAKKIKAKVSDKWSARKLADIDFEEE